jgi:hypothetical protein
MQESQDDSCTQLTQNTEEIMSSASDLDRELKEKAARDDKRDQEMPRSMEAARVTPDELKEMQRPDLVSELMLQNEERFESCSLSEMQEAVRALCDKVWYDRHMGARQRGEDKEWNPDIREGAYKSAAKIERKYGKENLGPWSKWD